MGGVHRRSHDLAGGGARILFFRLGNLRIAMRIARGLEVCSPKTKKFNSAIWCILIGSDYVFKIFLKVPFFYIKNKYVLTFTRLL